jgi:large conductance mechanosensitive channel
MLKGFRDFILRGNVVDLAVAVVIGAAFTAVVQAVVKGIVTPLIGAIIGKPSFDDLTFTIHHSEFLYGSVINALITFVAVAAVVYFFVVQPMNIVQDRLKPGKPVDEPTRACPECLSDIPRKASRCAFCTASVTPASA